MNLTDIEFDNAYIALVIDIIGCKKIESQKLKFSMIICMCST